jgi:hypothetical protein
MLLMPLNTTDTAGWFQRHCNAQPAGDRFTLELSIAWRMEEGGRASLPSRWTN